LPEFDLRKYLPGGFVQGNGINRQLVSRVLGWVTESDGGTVLDAFCGVGNFALPLARRGWDELGLEVSPEAVVDGVVREGPRQAAGPEAVSSS